MKYLIFLYNKCFVADSLLVQAEKKMKQLSKERFDAIITKIQWECQVHSKVEQMNWIQSFIEENQK